MPSPQTVTLYHSSDVDFDTFTRMGDRTTSTLGAGYYLTPNIDKTTQYGNVVMQFEVDISNVLNWNELTNNQREKITDVLMDQVPEKVVSKYSKPLFEVIPLNPSGLERLKELQALTSDSESDMAKAIMIRPSEYPDEYKDLDKRKFGIVKWREADSLSGATDIQLLGLAQEYAPEIARHLGYNGAMYSDEVAVYSSDLAKKIKTLSLFEINLAKKIKQNENPSSINEGEKETCRLRKSLGIKML